MNRLTKLFENKDKNILSIFLTAGYPEFDSTVPVIEALDKQGIDMVEIGIPFSDPIADGPVIQSSSSKALNNGISLKAILRQIEEARKSVTSMPFILMGYFNPILKYGIENFFRDAAKVGVDGVIIPDLPFDEYLSDLKKLSKQYDLPVIMLITPETSDERIRLIDNHCDGFIYMVSAASTTGVKDKYTPEQVEYFERINSMNLKHHRLIGFGISNPTTYNQANMYASGAIIGSHFVKCLEKCEGDPDKAVEMLLSTIGKNRQAPRNP